MSPDQAAIMQQQQQQMQQIIQAFNIANPAHPGNQQHPKKFWIKVLLTEFQLNELKQLAQFLGSQPYTDPTTGKPIVDPQTGKQVHALDDTTVASLMKSASLGTYMKFKIEQWQQQQQQQAQQQQVPQQFQQPQG